MRNVIKLLVVALLLSFVFVNCGGPATPQDVVKDSFEMMANNDKAGVKDLLSSQVKALVDDKKLDEGINNKYEEIKAKGGITNIEFLSEDIEENEANFKVRLTYGDGSTDDEKAKVVKEDGEWKLGISK
ncbi:MAG: DUF4878 domain-containing protein [Melioribacteraceae bacterium]|nr:DUF4878 domain-containing protein [Melioribacteraceae bacterium]WKZ68273.1 MAG: DUF4878 domain-containing protein [Melioribacteraceae bacterium]